MRTPDFSPSPWQPLVEAASRKKMDALLVTIQVNGGFIANWHDSNRQTNANDERERELNNAMNAARSKVRA
jgi:hypothetical protein